MFLTMKYYTIKFGSCMNKFPIKINLCSHNFYAFVWLKLTEDFQVFQETTNRNAYIFDFFLVRFQFVTLILTEPSLLLKCQIKKKKVKYLFFSSIPFIMYNFRASR